MVKNTNRLGDQRRKLNILIIGGGSGIGALTVTALRQAGHHVIFTDCNRDTANFNLSSDSSIYLDLTDTDTFDHLLKFLINRGLTLDGLVISAAVHSSGLFHSESDHEISRVYDINLVNHVKLLRRLLPYLGPGSLIVPISSIGSILGLPFSCLYSSSKAALDNFYEGLSHELVAYGIRISIIQPGNTNTGFNETGNKYISDIKENLNRSAYMKFLGKIKSSNGMAPVIIADKIVLMFGGKPHKLYYRMGWNCVKAYWAVRLLGRSRALCMMRKYFNI